MQCERGGRLGSRERVWIALGLAAAVGFAGCRKADSEDTASAEPAPTVIGPENIAVAERTKLSAGPTISGALAAERQAEIRAEVGGSVVQVLVEQGQTVARGQVLVRLDATTLQDAALAARAAVRSAEATAQLAERNAERAERLSQAGAVADRDLEQANSTLANAQAGFADAKARLVSTEQQLAKATIRAPFAGVVSERPANAGDIVQPGTALVTVVDPSSMRLEGTVATEQLSALKVGTPVDFTVSGYDNKYFTGRIERVNPAVDPETRQVRIFVSLPNTKHALVAGLFAEGRVATASHDAVAAPLAALDERGATPAVLRLKAGRVQRVPVTLGLRDDVAELIELASGVAAGDTLLLGAVHSLAEGTVVRVRQDEPASPARSGSPTR